MQQKPRGATLAFERGGMGVRERGSEANSVLGQLLKPLLTLWEPTTVSCPLAVVLPLAGINEPPYGKLYTAHNLPRCLHKAHWQLQVSAIPTINKNKRAQDKIFKGKTKTVGKEKLFEITLVNCSFCT